MRSTMLLDGRWVSFSPGQTILQAAQAAGVYIPTLCYYKESGHCDVCRICVVEAEGTEKLLPACSTQVREGMEVWTNTERVAISRRRTIDMLLASGRHACLACDANGDCGLQDLAYNQEASPSESLPPTDRFPNAFDDPFIIRDYSKCILCGRCIAACSDVQVNDAIRNPFGRREEHEDSGGWFPLPDPAKCVECGQCVEVCPVGALREKAARGAARIWETDKIRTTCPHCGVGCRQTVHAKDGKIAKITAVPDALPDKGRLCVKGRFLYDFVYSKDRLLSPQVRKSGKLRKASWDDALNFAASHLKKIIRRHGPDSVAGLCSSRAANEDAYNMQKLFRAVIGTNNIDNIGASNTLAASFGLGAATNSLGELSGARAIFCIGADMAEENPVAATFVKNAVRSGGELIAAGYGADRMSEHAAVRAVIRRGSEAAFINGLAGVIISEGLYDRDFVRDNCDGFDEFMAFVSAWTPERAAELSGADAETIRGIARRLAKVRPVAICYVPAAGSGAGAAASLANLQMLLGGFGEGGGVNILNARANAQGACDMGAMPDMLPGCQSVQDIAILEKFNRAWGVSGLPPKPGMAFADVAGALVGGGIKAFYCFGEDPAGDLPAFKEALASAELVVCQDILATETSRMAHVVLPSAAWCEADGAFTNSERRVSRVRKAKEPAGLARPGWWIFREIAGRMGQDWASESAHEIWDNEISKLAPLFSGITYRRLEGDGIQWPCPDEGHPGTPALHKGGRFARGKGLFIPCE